jgi:hypothetical protein
MTWQQRLRALTLAGGALVAGCNNGLPPQGGGDMASTDLSFSFVCNANPDPCCNDPTPQLPSLCAAKKKCIADGDDWSDAHEVCLRDGGTRD